MQWWEVQALGPLRRKKRKEGAVLFPWRGFSSSASPAFLLLCHGIVSFSPTVSAMSQSICLQERAAGMTPAPGWLWVCALWARAYMATCCLGFNLACPALQGRKHFLPTLGHHRGHFWGKVFGGKHQVGERHAQSPITSEPLRLGSVELFLILSGCPFHAPLFLPSQPSKALQTQHSPPLGIPAGTWRARPGHEIFYLNPF